MLLFIQSSGKLQKRNGIPGIPDDSSIGYMYMRKDDLNKHRIEKKLNLFLKPNSLEASYFEGFNPLVFGILIIAVLTFIFVLGLTISYKAHLFVKKNFPNRIKKSKDCLMEIILPDENSPLPTPVELESKYDLRRYPESSVHKEVELMDLQLATLNSNLKSKILLTHNAKELSQFNIHTILQKNKTNRKNRIEDNNLIENNRKLKYSKNKIRPVSYKKPVTCKIINLYSTKQIQNYFQLENFKQASGHSPSTKFLNNLHMEPFLEVKNIEANINTLKPLLLGLINTSDINTVEILLFKLFTMLVNPQENCYVFHPVLSKLIENYFTKGTVLQHFFLTKNYLLQDYFLNCILGYLDAHLNFPVFGNTSFISYNFHSVKNFDKEPFCYSPSLLLSLLLIFHINFEETSNNKIENINSLKQLVEINAFLEKVLPILSIKSDSVNELILTFIASIELVMKTTTNKTFIYLQSILKIYNSHLLCCLKKKVDAHISLNTDKKLFEILTLVLNSNNLTINIKKLIHAIALLLGKHRCPLEFTNKLETIINIENVESICCEKKNMLPILLINKTPGSWV